MFKWAEKGRVGWLLCFTLVLLAAGSMPVVADPSGGEVPAESSAPTEESLVEATQTVEKEEQERAQWLLSPEAIEQREASQSAFDALSAGEAQSLLVGTFPEQFAELNADPARVLSELEIEKPLGTYGARIAADGGESAIVESAVPVQSNLGGNGNEPVDLALERSGPAFVPRNPLAKVELPESAEDAIKLHSGIAVELPTSGDLESWGRPPWIRPTDCALSIRSAS